MEPNQLDMRVSNQEAPVSSSPNPFTPIFGQVPLHLAGRAAVIAEVEAALDGSDFDPSLVSIFVGARGIGKTALLSLLADRAEGHGWISVKVTAVKHMLDNVYEQALKKAAHLVESPQGQKHLTGMTVSGFGVSWQPPQTLPGTWRTKMESFLDALGDQGVGLLVCVDEVDPALDEMIELAATFQHFIGDGRKVALFMAGLPSRVLELLSSGSATFLRRACQYQLGAVSDYEIEEAFASTIRDGGRSIAPDALHAAVSAIGGFPFMMQLVGYRAWNSGGGAEVTLADVEVGAARARAELRERVYDATFRELSKGDRDFLRAMLDDEGPSNLADVRARLGKTAAQVSYQKKRLVGQGIVRDVARGVVAFDMPGMREYLCEALSEENF